MTEADIPFIEYWNAVDHFLKHHHCVDTWEAGIGADELALAQEQLISPEEFALTAGVWLRDPDTAGDPA